MSRIRKLSIKGIRNFDDTGKSSNIRFDCPLTLILGPNGTGKTTIIECLKYALSGDFPPDSDRGKAFIHEPIAKKFENVLIRGNVKVEIDECSGNDIVTVSRSIEATRQEKSLRFKTLDSTLSRKNKETGHQNTITSKCADIDTEVMSAMGISKAILNYVLFCHQDDANWPFETGKKLKERFDEIFDTTRYNRALDAVRKLVKDKQAEIKGLLTEKQAFNIIVEEVRSKQKKLENCQQRQVELQTKIDELTKGLEPINERLMEIREMEKECCKWQMEDEKKKMEYQHAMEQIATLKENIKETYVGSTESLTNEIESYEKILREKNTEIADLERELREGTEKEAKISKIIAERRVTVGTLRQQMHDQTVRVAKRNETLRDMFATWEMNETIEPNVSEEDAIRLTKKMEERLRRVEQEMETRRAEQEREQEQFQRKVNTLRAERATIESQLAHNERELINVKREIRTNRSILQQAGAMEQKLNEVDANLAEANKKVAEVTKKIENESIQRQIQEATALEEENERKCNEVEKEISSLREQSALQIKLASNQAELADKENETLLLKEKHSDTLKKLLGNTDICEGNMTQIVNDVETVLNKRVQNVRNEIEKYQYEEMKLKTSVEHKKKELDNKLQQIESDKEKLSVHCKDYTNYRDVLLLHSKKVKELEDKRGMYAYQAAAYKEYIKTVSSESCCPLCHRGFENSREAAGLVTELKNETSNQPDRLRNCEKELASQRSKYDSLLKLQPVVEKIEEFERVEVVKTRKQLDEDAKKLAAFSQRLKRLRESLSEPEKKLSACKNMIGDMALWDRYAEEIADLQAKIDDVQDFLRSSGVNSNRTIDEAEAEYNNLQQILKDARREIKTLQVSLDSRNEELRRATENRTKLLEQQLRIHKEMQDIKLAKEALDSLLAKEIEVGKNVKEFEERMADIDDKLVTAIDDLERVKQDFRTDQEANRKKLRERSKEYDQLNSIHTEVKEFAARKVDDQLRSTEEQLLTAEKKAVEMQTLRTSRESKISKMKQDINRHDTRKRDLVDNLTLRRRETEIETLKAERRKLKEKLVGSNYAAIAKERENLCQSRDNTERERNVARGGEEELERNIDQLKAELNKREYRNAQENYKTKCAQLVVARQCREDLHTYGNVLDVATIQFHEERMATVNRYMQKLWKLIYTGTDTTSLQIRTEATVSNVDKRRQFNYKLVQVKHGVDMDMRGRCSAGQKVLASIILRLALAETFCEKCGVLALDEPTTNLDEANAKSLADALHKYVNLRKDQKNFQLIVITHDDNFIPKLGELSTNNVYFQLYRYDNGLSGIKCVAMKCERDSSDDENDEKDDIAVRAEVPRPKRALTASTSAAGSKPKKHKFY